LKHFIVHFENNKKAKKVLYNRILEYSSHKSVTRNNSDNFQNFIIGSKPTG